MIRLLVMEPDPALRDELTRVLRAAGYESEAVGDAQAARAIVAAGRVQAALVDVTPEAGLAELDALRAGAPGLELVAMGSQPSVELVVEALRRGAHDFLRKPFRVPALERALAAMLQRMGPAPDGCGLLTCDPAMLRLLDEARRAAATEATIRIVGESGTGKELLARWVHQHSRRSRGAFVLVNCAGLQESLVESELFGHERGAFTGAVSSRTGQIAAAHGGTLVLDEVSDLALGLQPKLLRAIQEREVTPVGATTPQAVDVRIVATTQRPLGDEVAAGRFRSDLYYRLDVITLQLPPLRERPDDVPLLARTFLERYTRAGGEPPPRLGDAALKALTALPLRGNVRELENLMRRAAVLFPGRDVDVARLLSRGPGAREALPEKLRTLNLRELERAAVTRSLIESRGNRTLASRALGISVRTLRNKIRLYDLA